MRRTLITAAAAAAGALALAGLGASTVTTAAAKSSQTAIRAPSKARFIASADAICQHNARRQAPLLNHLPPTDSPAHWQAFATVITRAQSIFAAGNMQLRALPEPSSGHAAIAAWLTARDSETALITTLIRAADHESFSATILTEVKLAHAEGVAEGLAQAYGFKACGHS